MTNPQSKTEPTERSSRSWPAMSFTETHAILTAAGSRFELTDVTVRGIPLRTWKQTPPTLRDVFVTARSHGDATFLVYEEERISFEAFARAAIAFARELRARGVIKGDRVAIAMRNLPEWPAIFHGAMLCGAIVAPLNAWWLGAELEYGLRDCGATVLVADAERYDRLRGHLNACPDLRDVFVARATAPLPPHVTALESVIGRSVGWASLPDEETPDVVLTPEDEVCILFTSGTTGKPKGALMTHRNIMSSFPSGSFGTSRNALRHRGALPAPRGRGFALLLSVPFFHANGCFIQLVPAMLYGGKLVLMHKWNAERAMQLIEREHITHTGGVPTVAQELATHPDRDRYDLSSLEAIGWGGASSPPELVAMVQERFPGVWATNAWGMTETSGGVTQQAGRDYEARPDSAGVALPIWDIKVTDADGATLPPNGVGELWAKGPGVIKGYWNRPEDTAETFIAGWVRSGDIARIDENGFLFIVDRKKDMLIRGGENIYCVEIENAFYEHPDVIDAAIVPVPHATLGEVPGAVVHLRSGASTSGPELRGFVATRLAAFKVPVEVLLQPEPLPRNQGGKIMKRELRSLFAPVGSG
jgi:long-chain acyl-CoA synthetase